MIRVNKRILREVQIRRVLLKTRNDIELIIELTLDRENNRDKEVDLTDMKIILRKDYEEKEFDIIEYLSELSISMKNVSAMKLKNMFLTKEDLRVITTYLDRVDFANLAVSMCNGDIDSDKHHIIYI